MRATLIAVCDHHKDIAGVSSFYGIEHKRMSAIIRSQRVPVTFDLTKNSSRTVRGGRKAEEFVKSQPEFRVKRDCLETNGAVYGFDLVIGGYGAIDVKSTELRRETPRGYSQQQEFYRFSCQDVDNRTKYLFLVGYDGGRVRHLFIVPKQDFRGVSTIQIFISPLRGRYSRFLHKEY
jgi:hypothetical protein